MIETQTEKKKTMGNELEMRCIQEVHKDMEGARVPKRLSLTLDPKTLNPKTLKP